MKTKQISIAWPAADLKKYNLWATWIKPNQDAITEVVAYLVNDGRGGYFLSAEQLADFVRAGVLPATTTAYNRPANIDVFLEKNYEWYERYHN